MKKILIFCLLACLLQSVNVQGQASKYTTSIVTGSGAPVYTPSVSKKESTTYYDYSNKRLYGHNGTAWELLSIEFTNGVPSNGIDTKVKFVIDSLNNAVYTRKNGMFSAMVSVNIKKYTDGIASVNDTAKYAFQQIGKTYAYFDSTANSLIKIDRELTIRDFGAIEGTVGSGQRTINSTAIRNYISKLGFLKIPKGVWQYDSCIVLREGQIILGNNRDSTVLEYTGSWRAISATAISHIELMNFSLKNTNAAANGIYLGNTRYSKFHDLLIGSNTRFKNNIIIHGYSDNDGNTFSLDFQRVRSFQAADWGVYMYGNATGSEITFKDCQIEMNGSGTNVGNVYIATDDAAFLAWNSLTFRNCLFQGTSAYPFVCEGVNILNLDNCYWEQAVGATNPLVFFGKLTASSGTYSRNVKITSANMGARSTITNALVYAKVNADLRCDISDVNVSVDNNDNTPFFKGDGYVNAKLSNINYLTANNYLFSSYTGGSRMQIDNRQFGSVIKNANGTIIPYGFSFWQNDTLGVLLTDTAFVNKNIVIGDNHVGTVKNVNFGIKTNNTEKLSILNTGQVAIGQSGDVNSKLAITSNLAQTFYAINNGTSGFKIAGVFSAVGSMSTANGFYSEAATTAGGSFSVAIWANSYLGTNKTDLFLGNASFPSGSWGIYSASARNNYLGQLNTGINTINPQYKLDIDAKTASSGNPIRAKGLINTNSPDSIIVVRTANEGVFERTGLNTVVSKVFQDSCVSGTAVLTAVGAASAAGVTVNFGRSIQTPQIHLTPTSSNSINAVTAYASSITATGFIANACNLGGASVDVNIYYRVCPNNGQGY